MSQPEIQRLYMTLFHTIHQDPLVLERINIQLKLGLIDTTFLTDGSKFLNQKASEIASPVSNAESAQTITHVYDTLAHLSALCGPDHAIQYLHQIINHQSTQQ